MSRRSTVNLVLTLSLEGGGVIDLVVSLHRSVTEKVRFGHL
jgi:hypothetical protein